MKKQKSFDFCFGSRRRPNLPGRCQPSTFGAKRLNFCVRDGYRWCPLAIVTGILRVRAFALPLGSTCASPRLLRPRFGFRLRTFKTAQWKVDLQSPFSISLACASLSLPARFLAYRFRSSCRPISIGKLPDCSAFTADLSPDRLSGVFVLAYWNLLLEVGFTLRCLQRLSTPHFASQLCRWHDNCCTRDASTPVLSY